MSTFLNIYICGNSLKSKHYNDYIKYIYSTLHNLNRGKQVAIKSEVKFKINAVRRSVSISIPEIWFSTEMLVLGLLFGWNLNEKCEKYFFLTNDKLQYQQLHFDAISDTLQ